MWNPKTIFADQLNKSSVKYHRIGEHTSTHCRLLDSGLFILANRQPTDNGFITFQQPSWNTEEVAANKGLLWALFLTTPSSSSSPPNSGSSSCKEEDTGPQVEKKTPRVKFF